VSVLQRLLLLPCLAPLLVVLVLSAVSGSKPAQLRLLTWESPSLPLGAWTAISAGGGALVAGTLGLMLRPSQQPLRRSVRRSVRPENPPQYNVDDGPPIRRAGPSRDPRDPAPTVSVPFRVIEKSSADAAQAQPQPRQSATVATASAQDDWGDDPDQDW